MKKILLISVVIFLAPLLQAFELSNTYTYNSRFWNNSSFIGIEPFYGFNIGGQFDITEHDDFKNHIYTASLPMSLNTRWFGMAFIPFIIPDNANDASAWGGKVLFSVNAYQNEEEGYTAGIYASAAYASQDAYVERKGAAAQKENDYRQLTYEAGLKYDFFETYGIDISGNIFHYPDGVTDVNVRGVLNQQLLAGLSTLDYVLGLPKGSAGATISWHSAPSASDNYIAYRYIKFNDRQNVHSLLLATSMQVKYNLFVNLSYNHLFIPGSADRDIFSGGLSIKF